jgi:hypothetical protein
LFRAACRTGYFRPISASNPNTTGRAALSSSKVDQQLAEGSSLRVSPELADPIGPFEVGEAPDVEEFGAGRRRACLEAPARRLLHLLEGHDEDPTHRQPRLEFLG